MVFGLDWRRADNKRRGGDAVRLGSRDFYTFMNFIYIWGVGMIN